MNFPRLNFPRLASALPALALLCLGCAPAPPPPPPAELVRQPAASPVPKINASAPVPAAPGVRPLEPSIWTAKRNFALGEPMEFFFACDGDCYVYVFNTDAAGYTAQIFPNYFDRANFVRRGRAYKMPGRQGGEYHFRMEPPAGAETVTIVAVADRYQPVRPLHEGWSRGDPFPKAASPRDLLRKLGELRSPAFGAATLVIESR